MARALQSDQQGLQRTNMTSNNTTEVSPNPTAAAIATDSQRRYTYLYPEGEGYYHIRFLGSGAQGTACLVRCVKTGELFVRKRTFAWDTKSDTREADYSRAINHSNVVKCCGAYNYIVSQQKKNLVSDVTYWRYASHLDLRTLILTFRANRYRVPEIVIWRYLKEITAANNQFHRQGLFHNDGRDGNIFVNWERNEMLPTFVVGDLGCTKPFQQRAADHFDLEYDGPAVDLPSLADIDPDVPYRMVHSPYAEMCLSNVRTDFGFILSNIVDMMSGCRYEYSGVSGFCLDAPERGNAGPRSVTQDMTLCSSRAGKSLQHGYLDELDDHFYSQELHAFKDLLGQFTKYIIRDEVRTFERYQHLFGELHEYICAQEARCWNAGLSAETRRALEVARREAGRSHGETFPLENLKPCVCTVAEKSSCADPDITLPSIETVMYPDIDEQRQCPGHHTDRPALFRSHTELLDCKFRPVGPWHIAQVDGLTLQLTEVDPMVRDLDRAQCTDGYGRKVEKEPWHEVN